MKMVLTFDSLEEMKNFAVKMAGTEEPQAPAVPVSQPTLPEQPAPTVPTVSMTPTAPAPQTMPPVRTAQTTPVSTTVPTAAVTYTADDLARAAMTLMDSGRQIELINLLAQFGAASITELKPNQFGAFATALRGLGAQI
jgi:hypothetical protein